jgi:hypothetical protein
MAKRGGLRWKSIGLKEEERLTAGLVHHRRPTWSSDGKWLAYAAGDQADACWVVSDRRGRVARVLTGAAAGGASFSPEGALAFGRKAGARAEIWLAAGGLPPVRLLGGDGASYADPAFSPDGRLLAYTATEAPDAPSRLYILELAGGQRHALHHEPDRTDAHPTFTPDGEELLFDGAQADDVAVYALRFQNHALERVSAMRTVSRHPAALTRELLVVERPGEGGCRLVAIDRREHRERELLVDDAAPARDEDLRDPCATTGRSGKVRLAFARLVRDGELRRYEVCIARMKGVGAAEELDDAPAADEKPAEPEVVTA